jgi:hypothetical protein
MNADSYPWERKVANPDKLGPKEKEFWKKIEPILSNLLDEIKGNRKLKTIYVKAEMDRIYDVLKANEETGITHNILINLLRHREQRLKFLQAVEQFGFKGTDMFRVYLSLATAVALLSIEHFKLLLLFHMTNVGKKISKFPYTMQSYAPKTWPLLKPYVDNEFRNALAHGTYAYVKGKIALYDDAELVPFKEMTLSDFMVRTKEPNVLFICLLSLLAAKKRLGFFT